MTASLLFKLVIFLLFGLILLSLFGGALFLARDKSGSKRTVYSLTIRVALSVILFLLLIVGFYTGLLTPHGLLPEPPVGGTETEPGGGSP